MNEQTNWVPNMTVTKTLERQKAVFDKKRMDIALKSHRVAMPPGLTREEKRAFILSQHNGI